MLHVRTLLPSQLARRPPAGWMAISSVSRDARKFLKRALPREPARRVDDLVECRSDVLAIAVASLENSLPRPPSPLLARCAGGVLEDGTNANARLSTADRHPRMDNVDVLHRIKCFMAAQPAKPAKCNDDPPRFARRRLDTAVCPIMRYEYLTIFVGVDVRGQSIERVFPR
ncbi:MAG: hypothetical protein R3C05_06735 [Pirellulaceae bacterium]